jgi:anaerobic ribonucleoside-triphosphate reductase
VAGKAIEYIWKFCPECLKTERTGTVSMKGSTKHCGYCGAKLVNYKTVICPRCDEEYPASARFKYCIRCGRKTEKRKKVKIV